MKKIFLGLLFFGLFLGSSCHAQYYKHAIGLRGGTSFGLSYKRFITDWPFQQAFEVVACFQLDEGFMLWNRKPIIVRGAPLSQSGIVQNGAVVEGYYVAHLDIGFDTRFAAYAGLGVFMGPYFASNRKPFFGGGGVAQLGIEYNFRNVPINIAIEWNPLFGYPRVSPARGAFTVRYIFREGWN